MRIQVLDQQIVLVQDFLYIRKELSYLYLGIMQKH